MSPPILPVDLVSMPPGAIAPPPLLATGAILARLTGRYGMWGALYRNGIKQLNSCSPIKTGKTGKRVGCSRAAYRITKFGIAHSQILRKDSQILGRDVIKRQITRAKRIANRRQITLPNRRS